MEDNTQLKAQLSSHLSDLDQMTLRMKQSLAVGEHLHRDDDIRRDEPPVYPDFSLT